MHKGQSSPSLVETNCKGFQNTIRSVLAIILLATMYEIKRVVRKELKEHRNGIPSHPYITTQMQESE